MTIQFNLFWSLIGGNAEKHRSAIAGTEISDVTSPYLHTSLEPGETYYYVVTAYDDVLEAESIASNEVSADPLAPPNSTGQIIW